MTEDRLEQRPGRPPAEPPPPLEADDRLITAVFTAGWAVALVVLLIVRTSLPSGSRWWIWTCAAGLGMGLFGLWYVPRLKRGRARTAERRAASRAAPAAEAQADATDATAGEADADG